MISHLPQQLPNFGHRERRVNHPDYAALGKDHATLLFTDDAGRIELIRLSQLESINVGEKPAA